MNIELLARQAIDKIKQEWGLPARGFLAGGSIANIIWEIVSGNKAVINDIDIFHFDGVQEKFDKNDKSSLFNFKNSEIKYYEDYTGLCFTIRTKEFYSIVEAERDGMFNNIKYKSNTQDPTLIIRSFDINATRVGYHIEEDKIYWTKEFEEFLQSGNLQVCNLVTPCHTAVRIAKKSIELNAKLDKFEMKLLQYSLARGFNDKIKWRFKEKYKKMYEDHINLLKSFFTIKRDTEGEQYVKGHYGQDVELYFLESVLPEKEFLGDMLPPNHRRYASEIFDDNNIDSIFTTTDFLFYMRNIFGNDNLKELWSKLQYFFISDNYVDREVSQEDIELLHRFSKYAPESIEKLKGLKLSEQIEIIKKFLDKYKDDPIIAISILESIKVDKDIVLDDDTALILELSVRKKIINDTRGKVKRILGLEKEEIQTNEIKLPF